MSARTRLQTRQETRGQRGLLLRNTRETGSVSSDPPKRFKRFSIAWRLASAPFALFCASALLNATAIPLHDFGSVAVGASAATYTFSASFSGVSVSPAWSLTGTSFSIASTTCAVTGGTSNCNVSVSFAPLYPGLQLGALYAKNSAGSLLATYFLKGVGNASEMVFAPGIAGTQAGTGVWGYADGPLTSAAFRDPSGLAVDQAGNLYVADSVNQVVRKVSATAVTTVAGVGLSSGYTGDNGLATSAKLNSPTGVAVDAANNLYIADQGNNVIRRVDAISGIITTVAGGGSVFVTPASSNVQALSASLYGPQAVVVDAAGNLFLSASYYQTVYRVDAATNVMTAYAGNGTGGGTDSLGDGAAATSAILNNPTGLALDSSSNLYIADSGHNMIRKVNVLTGVITAVAGNGNYGYSGDGGLATGASLKSPMEVRVDAAGNMYIADWGNSAVRQTFAATGVITTMAGTGAAAYSGDGALATSASLANPSDVALGPSGILFIADYANNVIRRVTPVSPSLNFGSIVVGAASAAQAVTLVNRGNQALTLSGGSFGTGFRQVSGLDDCTASSVLQPGGTCTANMAFAPTATGSFSTNLALTSNSLNVVNTQNVGMSGVGVAGNAPQVTLSGTSLNFGTIGVFTGQSQTVTLTNTGAAALSIAGLSLTGNGSAGFNLSTTCGSSLAAGIGCSITLTFTPNTITSYSASLAINDTAGSSPQTISMTGTGKSNSVVGLVQQWDNNGLLYLMSYGLNNSTISVTQWTDTGQGYGSAPDGTPDLIPLDINGDGKLDLVQQWDNQGVLYLLPYTATGSTFSFGNWINTGQGYASISSGKPGLIPMDINGDGKTDLIQQWDNAGILWLMPFISTGSTFRVTNWINTGQGYASLPDKTPGLIPMDINGDGKMDLVQQWDNNGVLWLLPYISNGTTLTPMNWINTGQGYASLPDGTPGLIPMDINGDGKMDLVQQWVNNGVLWLLPYISNGNTFNLPGWIDTGQGYKSNPDGTPDLIPMDINGDGRMDLVQQWDNNGVLWLLPYISNGSTLSITNWINTNQGYGSNPDGTPGLIPMDINGDGKTDLIQQWSNQGVLFLLPYVSTGSSFSVTNWINTNQGYASIPAGTPGFLGGTRLNRKIWSY